VSGANSSGALTGEWRGPIENPLNGEAAHIQTAAAGEHSGAPMPPNSAMNPTAILALISWSSPSVARCARDNRTVGDCLSLLMPFGGTVAAAGYCSARQGTHVQRHDVNLTGFEDLAERYADELSAQFRTLSAPMISLDTQFDFKILWSEANPSLSGETNAKRNGIETSG